MSSMHSIFQDAASAIEAFAAVGLLALTWAVQNARRSAQRRALAELESRRPKGSKASTPIKRRR
jgi:hypothetical protein